MTGMKVAISLPDAVFRAAERLARRLKKSRSELYADAIAAYVGANGAKALTEKLNAVYGSQASGLETAVKHAQLDRLSREAW
jgi:metal-responsive CopG/Arc/MetJ family transcriptional regulator